VRSQGLLIDFDAETQQLSSLAEAYDALGLLAPILAEARALPAPPGAAAEPSAEALVARWTKHVRAEDGAA
jgi:hypothetical protein